MVTAAMLDPKVTNTRAVGAGRTSLVGGHVTGRAYGDAGTPDLDINSDVRGARAAQPGKGLLSWLLGRSGGSTSFGGYRHPPQQESGPWYSPGGPGGAYGGGWADGILTVRDRHIMTRHGTVRNPDGGGSSMPSADRTHPVPPRYQMVNTTESWQLGTDLTTQEDNPGPHYTVEVTGTAKRFPLGQQDGTAVQVMGPPLGEWREYGARGGTGMHGPPPDVVDPNWIPARGAGGAGGRGMVTQPGAPGMQAADKRFVYGGVPHGLHSPTVNSTALTGARYASTPQMTPPRLDRPASSKNAGQSMSQMYPPEGGGGIGQTPRTTEVTRQPGMLGRFMART